MLYRLKLDLAFDTEDVPQAIFDRAKQVLVNAVKISSAKNTDGDTSFIEIHKCYHDEDPVKPCEVIKRVEL